MIRLVALVLATPAAAHASCFDYWSATSGTLRDAVQGLAGLGALALLGAAGWRLAARYRGALARRRQTTAAVATTSPTTITPDAGPT